MTTNRERKRIRGPSFVDRAHRRGTTAVELLLVMLILVVALSIFSGTVAATSRQRTINRENAIASEAARQTFEAMRAVPLLEVWPRFNADPADDPGGAGTAPGHRFAVSDLSPVDTSADGLIGEVHFPALNTGTELAPVWELREDAPMRPLGMPRDLNGDLSIDSLDHGADYVRLPVEIELRWTGETGDRSLSITTMLCEYDFGG